MVKAKTRRNQQRTAKRKATRLMKSLIAECITMKLKTGSTEVYLDPPSARLMSTATDKHVDWGTMTHERLVAYCQQGLKILRWYDKDQCV